MQAVAVKQEWMSLVAAGRHVDRSVEELLALEGKRSYRRGFPARHRVNGRAVVSRPEFETWAVEAGLVTPDGDVLVGYEDIAILLDVAVQTVRIWERDRKANILLHGAADESDIPNPVDVYWSTGASGRVMYRKRDIVQWDRTIRRRATGRYRKKFHARS